MDHLDQASNGMPSPGPSTHIRSGPPGPSWLDLLGWCSRLGAAGDIHARRAVLREWVAAAGGWSDAAAIHLPATLPNRLALATLKAHARALRLDVRVDPDDPALMRWPRGAVP
jgi:hypothetical protein